MKCSEMKKSELKRAEEVISEWFGFVLHGGGPRPFGHTEPIVARLFVDEKR